MASSARTYLTPGISLTLASAVAFAPLLAGAPIPHASISRPHLSMPSVTLSAAISPADIDKLIDNLNGALSATSDTVAGLVGAPGQTLVSALNTAVELNNSLWTQLSTATDNTFLRQVLAALRASSSSGLSSLADTVTSSNSTLTLTTGQLADLLSSVLTGSLSTALHAVGNLLNNPLALSSYTGLINVPLSVAGVALTGGIAAVSDLAVNGLSLTSTLVTGVTAQVTNALSVFNGLVDAAKGAVGVDLIDGALTAVQGIVAAPVTAAVAAVAGGVPALTGALAGVVTRLAGGATGIVDTWLGDGTDPGALQRVINTVGAAPLSPASYTNALSILVGAGVTTGAQVVHSVSSLASIPFTLGANLVFTGSDVLQKLASATATVASGLLQAVGMPSYIHNLPYTIASVVNFAIQTAATVTAAGLNTIGAALDIGSSITGIVTGTNTNVVSLSTASAAGTRSLKAAAAAEPATGESAADLTSGAVKTTTEDATTTVEEAQPTAAAASTETVAEKTAAETESKTEETGPAPAAATEATDTAASKPTTEPTSEPTTEPAAKDTTDSSPKHDTDSNSETTRTTGQSSSPDSSTASTSGSTTPKTGTQTTEAKPTTTPAASGKDSAGAGTSSTAGGSSTRTGTGSSEQSGNTPSSASSGTGKSTPRSTTSEPKHAAGSTEGGSSVNSIKSRLAHESQTGKGDAATGKHTKAAA